MKPEGKKDSVLETARAGMGSQVHNEDVEAVLLSDSKWYGIVPGSFKLYTTAQNVPFIQFDTYDGPVGVNGKRRIEAFPASLVAVRYEVKGDV